jgi:hypothetical protein
MQGTRTQLDQRLSSNVEMTMKAELDLSLWSIIERLQRRLERQGLSAAAADRAVTIALRTLATAR